MSEGSPTSLQHSIAKQLFFGEVEPEKLIPFPLIPAQQSETLQLILDSVQKFMRSHKKDYSEFDTHGAQPDQYIQELRDLGLFGLIIPEEYGGIGLSNAGYSRVLQHSSMYDASTSLTVGAHSSIGMKGLLLFGTPEQKQKYLPRLANGELIAAFCLTEPSSGSDAGSVRTEAKKNADGTWTLNGEKLWITNGSLAGFFTVFARTGSEHGKLTAFIVEREFKGVSNGPKEDKLGIRASSTTTVAFENVRLPAENVLGGEGNGFKVAMSILNNGRTGLGGGCVGGMKAIIYHSLKQAKDRKQFGKSISDFGLVKEKIAQMTVACFATESVVQSVASLIDSGSQDYSVEAAISKIFASESLWMVANEGLQIAAGNGYMKEYPYERILRDSRINMIFEGTNEILRLYVGLSGLKEVGESLKELKGVFNHPIKGFGVLTSYVALRAQRFSPRSRSWIDLLHPSLREQAQLIDVYTKRLGTAADASLRKLGKNIIGEQYTTKRFAELGIDLFVSLCLLSRVSSLIKAKGEEASKDERNIAKIFINQAKRRANANLRRLVTNEDPETSALADSMIAKEKFEWDVF